MAEPSVRDKGSELESYVSETIVDVANRIREYSRSQKELWQKIPTLALEIQGRDGYSDNYSRAIFGGYWALDSSVDERGRFNVYVDVNTGELIDALSASGFIVGDSVGSTPPKEDHKLAKDLDVVNAYDPKEFDLPSIIESLEEQARKPHSKYASKTEEEAEDWRAEIREKLGLEKPDL